MKIFQHMKNNHNFLKINSDKQRSSLARPRPSHGLGRVRAARVFARVGLLLPASLLASSRPHGGDRASRGVSQTLMDEPTKSAENLLRRSLFELAPSLTGV